MVTGLSWRRTCVRILSRKLLRPVTFAIVRMGLTPYHFREDGSDTGFDNGINGKDCDMPSAEMTIRGLLEKAGVEVNGPNPWDPRVTNPQLYPRILSQGGLGLGEAYMDGWWNCADIAEFLNRVFRADVRKHIGLTVPRALLLLQSRVMNMQSIKRAFLVGKKHYDLGEDLLHAIYADRRFTGSCGYWSGTPAARTLDEAQEAKLDLACRKIGLKPGDTVFDIGCGWGSFMGFAALRYGARCTGTTISEDQAEYVRKRYAHLSVESHLADYRAYTPSSPVKHVVSIGMCEHVGTKNYRTYFSRARRAMGAGDGLFLLHTIVRNKRSPIVDPFINKYIFPNGVLPTVGQIGEAVEGLFVVEDWHNFGPDYGRTLVAWNESFQQHRTRFVVDPRYGETFCRMWEYYLLSCAGAFRSREISVGQFVLSPRGVPGGYTAVR